MQPPFIHLLLHVAELDRLPIDREGHHCPGVQVVSAHDFGFRHRTELVLKLHAVINHRHHPGSWCVLAWQELAEWNAEKTTPVRPAVGDAIFRFCLAGCPCVRDPAIVVHHCSVITAKPVISRARWRRWRLGLLCWRCGTACGAAVLRRKPRDLTRCLLLHRRDLFIVLLIAGGVHSLAALLTVAGHPMNDHGDDHDQRRALDREFEQVDKKAHGAADYRTQRHRVMDSRPRQYPSRSVGHWREILTIGHRVGTSASGTAGAHRRKRAKSLI